MDLRHHPGAPCREREGERLSVGNRVRVVAAVVKGVPDDRACYPLAQALDVTEAEGAVVVLDRQAGAGGWREELEALLEALEGCVHPAGRAADVEHDHRFGS